MTLPIYLQEKFIEEFTTPCTEIEGRLDMIGYHDNTTNLLEFLQEVYETGHSDGYKVGMADCKKHNHKFKDIYERARELEEFILNASRHDKNYDSRFQEKACILVGMLTARYETMQPVKKDHIRSDPKKVFGEQDPVVGKEGWK